jgi:hypothetical protein
MRTHPAQQEILLMTGTSFSANQWFKKDDSANLSEKDQLEEACWNGLLLEMLPELSGHTGSDQQLYLWQVRMSSSFIELELGEYPAEKDHYFSINPYIFTSVQLLS